MVLIMVTAWFPPNKSMEVAKKHFEIAQEFPRQSFEKLFIGGARATRNGIKDIMIVEVEKGKLEEALNLTARRLMEYFGIEGYRVEVETLVTLEEGLSLLGLAPHK